MNIEIGDIVIDHKGSKWVVYDFINYNGQEVAAVTDFETDIKNEVIFLGANIVEIIKKPKNVEWLFMKRRDNNLKGLELYTKGEKK